MRRAGSPDRIYVTRDDGSETGWTFPSYGEALPHDLVHWAVETTFALDEGLWGRVARGVDVARVNAMANRVGGRDTWHAMGPDLRHLLLSEALAVMAWTDDERGPEDLCAEARARVQEAGVELGREVTPVIVLELRRLLEDLLTRWRGLAPRGTLHLRFGRQP